MNEKCNSCKLRYDERPWCKGCENNFPGVDQFDLYQPIKHNIMMVMTNGLGQESYDSVVSCKIEDGKIVLTCADGSKVSYPNDGSWNMFDLTPTCGWNKNPGVIPEIHDKRQVKITLVRQRPSENSTWVDDIFLVMDASLFNAKGNVYWDYPDIVEKELRQFVQGWLQTKEGWKANNRASLDFNWGDLINELPIEMPRIKLTYESEDRIPINAAASISVNQDELLAPDDVLVTLLRSDGSRFGTGTVDFQTGAIDSVTSDQVMPKFDEPVLVRPNGSNEKGVPAHWDAKNRRYYLNI